MRISLLFLAVLGLAACKKKPAPPAETVPATEAPAKKPNPSLEQLQGVARKLAVRDPEPECAQIEAETDADPVATWLYIVNTVAVPPYTPMRAAGCLIDGHPDEASDSLVEWVRGQETQGLGRLVLANLDKLPEPVALKVVTAGLGGPLDGVVREAAEGSTREAVRKAAE